MPGCGFAAARGLYGGVLGVLEPHRSHVQVAIRGALAQGGSLSLWAGAGLVPGSEAAAEWQETSIKLDSLLKVWRHP
jgi:menaquinone-specific isochorismate synthase